jgi:hypothetical protein
MRISIKITTAAAAAVIGSISFAATPAMASTPAPICESGLSTVTCSSGAGGTATLTWTIIYNGGGLRPG